MLAEVPDDLEKRVCDRVRDRLGTHLNILGASDDDNKRIIGVLGALDKCILSNEAWITKCASNKDDKGARTIMQGRFEVELMSPAFKHILVCYLSEEHTFTCGEDQKKMTLEKKAEQLQTEIAWYFGRKARALVGDDLWEPWYSLGEISFIIVLRKQKTLNFPTLICFFPTFNLAWQSPMILNLQSCTKLLYH